MDKGGWRIEGGMDGGKGGTQNVRGGEEKGDEKRGGVEQGREISAEGGSDAGMCREEEGDGEWTRE